MVPKYFFHINTKIQLFLCVFSVACSSASIAQNQSQKQLISVQNYIKKTIKAKKIAGLVVLVKQDDKILHFSADGYQDIGEQIPMENQSIFRIYSMTKPLTSVAIMMLHERKILDLDMVVDAYIPELKDLKIMGETRSKKINSPITIRDLMRHTAGFSYGYFSQTKVDKLYQKKHPLHVLTNDEFIQRTAKLPLLYTPGEQHHYSIATDILGVVIERLSKQSLGDFFRTNIFGPLEMNDTEFWVPLSKSDRFCSTYKSDLSLKESYKKSPFLGKDKPRRESGGGGLVSTASDYMNFCTLLKNKGIFRGRQLLQEASIAEMTKNQLKAGDTLFKGIGFGLGFSVQLDEWGIYGHKGDYGWSGAASTHFFISPKENLAVIILSQKQPFSDTLLRELKPIIYASIPSK
jgi:CubicO group peptidase (beta-lactamase class C family)